MCELLEQLFILAEYTVYVWRWDDSLAVQVAIWEAVWSVVDLPVLLLRSWVTGRISALGSLPSTPLLAILEGIERVAQVLEDVWRLISMPVMYGMSTVGF